MNKFDAIWESIVQDLDESFGALSAKLPGGFLKQASTHHKRAYRSGEVYGKGGGIPGFGKDSQVITERVKTLAKAVNWGYVRRGLKDDKVISVIVVGVDSGNYVALMKDTSKIGYGYGASSRVNMKIDIYSSTYNKWADSSKKGYDQFIRDIQDSDTHAEIHTVYADMAGEQKRIARKLAREGLVPLPKDNGYGKYIDGIKTSLRSSVEALLRKRAPSANTADELIEILNTSLPDKLTYKGMAFKFDEIRTRNLGKGKDGWGEQNHISYKTIGYGDTWEYMDKNHPTLDRRSDEYQGIRDSLPTGIKIFLDFKAMNDIAIDRVEVYNDNNSREGKVIG